MKKTVFVVMSLTILAKALGFVKELILSYYYGTSAISDAYVIAITITMVFFSFVGIAINTTYIPMFTRIKNDNGKGQSIIFTNNLVNILIVISGAIVLLVYVFAPQIVKLFASGFSTETTEIAITLTRITIFSIFFSGIVYIFQGYLQVENDFFSPALVGAPLNLAVIASIIASTYFGFKLLGYGKILADIGQVLFLIPFLIKKNYKHSKIINFKDPKIKELIFLSIPIIIGTSVNQINQIVDRTIASSIAVGGITALNYANRLNLFIQGSFVAAFATVLYADLARNTATKNISEMKVNVRKAIGGINYILVPITIGIIIFSEPIVRLLFARGAFDEQSVVMTTSSLLFYSIGMIGYGLREVLSRVFYSMQDTKTPIKNAILGMILNIILNFILSHYLGIGGLALATSIAAIFTTILLFIKLRKKIGKLSTKKMISSFFKTVVSAIIMGVVVKLVFEFLGGYLSQNITLIISIVVGAVLYFAVTIIMKQEEAKTIMHSIRKKF